MDWIILIAVLLIAAYVRYAVIFLQKEVDSLKKVVWELAKFVEKMHPTELEEFLTPLDGGHYKVWKSINENSKS